MVAMSLGSALATDRREAPREEVFYRTRAARPGGASLPLQIVNISASGFMARTDEPIAVGEPFRLRLPIVGEVGATVRWSLGGRIGGQFDRMIELAPYLELLGALVRDAR
jgi:hypothetical protein